MKVSFDISHELSAWRQFTWTIKTYFLWKKKKIECHLLQILLDIFRVNDYCFLIVVGAPPPGGYYPGQPQGVPGQGPPTTVVVTQPAVAVVQTFRESPVHTRCPHCQAEVVTGTMYETGTFAWIICVVLCVIGYVLYLLSPLVSKCDVEIRFSILLVSLLNLAPFLKINIISWDQTWYVQTYRIWPNYSTAHLGFSKILGKLVVYYVPTYTKDTFLKK